ncbi:monoheme cytochrome C [Flagellimonas allohymeniacidonis]|uniref:Monoheme cytochrome C n=1 Tax=Flagellimonas allohymeniacidonis TaxID=2517819 RepID=A0A4Q8QCU9_9FLAO|nr:monoheme cytochrome C [Allomuricauda hymeniacidonis]TAI47307.1 monoheme cytochrome C [Allomuricauda hymeniacidonis]
MSEVFRKQVKRLMGMLTIFMFLIILFLGGLIYFQNHPEKLYLNAPEEELVEISEQIDDKIENGIHVRTGFVADEGMDLVIQNCTSCHSSKLVTQNRMSKEGWEATILWMQETQNLWDLGANQDVITAYLAKNYGPVAKGRRQNLKDIDWYPLK